MSRIKYEQRPSGLIAPVQPAPHKPKRGPLEIENEAERREAYRAVQVLMSITRNSGGIIKDDTAKLKAQRALVSGLSMVLLGDVEYEELC